MKIETISLLPTEQFIDKGVSIPKHRAQLEKTLMSDTPNANALQQEGIEIRVNSKGEFDNIIKDGVEVQQVLSTMN